MKKIAVLIVCTTILSACHSQYASTGDQLYETSRNGRNIVVPPPLTSANINHFYDLPRQEKHGAISVAPPVNS